MKLRFDLISQDHVPPTRSHVSDSHRDLPHGEKLVVLLELGRRQTAVDPVGPPTVREFRQEQNIIDSGIIANGSRSVAVLLGMLFPPLRWLQMGQSVLTARAWQPPAFFVYPAIIDRYH